jgi:2-iminoacetate synthase
LVASIIELLGLPIEPALGSELASESPAPVSDVDFCRLVAILRLAVPYTGIIMSTRESLTIRQKTLALGVSQISAGSRTDPGGYSDVGSTNANQFVSSDTRTTDDIVRDLAILGYIPSFCTACYRLGRTGEDFIHLAKHGNIKKTCTPNATATFAEYLYAYAASETREIGYKLIQTKLNNMSQSERQLTKKLLAQVSVGKRDVFV